MICLLSFLSKLFTSQPSNFASSITPPSHVLWWNTSRRLLALPNNNEAFRWNRELSVPAGSILIKRRGQSSSTLNNNSTFHFVFVNQSLCSYKFVKRLNGATFSDVPRIIRKSAFGKSFFLKRKGRDRHFCFLNSMIYFRTTFIKSCRKLFTKKYNI